MPKLKANGIEIYYEIHGEGEPLLMIMGLRRNTEWWYRQMPALSRHFKVIAFDNRGAGRTEKPEAEYSIGLFAEDTAGLMKSLEVADAHVLGISMGGYIAQELVIQYPHMVRDLILGCTSCGGEKAVPMSPERMEKFMANKGLSPEEILRKDMDIYFSERYIREHPSDVEEFIEISLRFYQPPEAFKRQFSACRKHDTADRISRVSVPTLIMSGDDDPLVPPENSRVLKELMPRAELSFLPGCRHAFFIEEADRFNNKVISFFGNHQSQSQEI